MVKVQLLRRKEGGRDRLFVYFPLGIVEEFDLHAGDEVDFEVVGPNALNLFRREE